MDIKNFVEAVKKINEEAVVHSWEMEISSPITRYISTQCPSLDLAIGKPGIPCGRVSILYGFESSGKSTLGLHLLSEAQKQGGLSVLIDTEYAFDPERGERIGIDYNNLIHLRPETMEESFEIINKIVAEKKNNEEVPFGLIVWDSLAATPVASEMSKKDKFFDLQPGQQAKVLSGSLRKIIKDIAESNIALLLINQMRENVGVFYGSKDIMPGGRAIKFYSTLILKLDSMGKIEEDGEIIGLKSKVVVEKNKIASPFRTAEFELSFIDGIRIPHSYLDVCVEKKWVNQGGGWFEIRDEELQKFYSGKFRKSQWVEEIFNVELKEIIDKKLWDEV